MRTFKIKTLMFVAAVATLPIACGTSAVTGPDASSLAAPESTVSALRSVDPLPPTAPAPSSPESVPMPGTPTADDVKGGGGSTGPTNEHHAPAAAPHGTPVPPGDPGTPPGAPKCLAASVDITMPLITSYAGNPSVALTATLRDALGVAITDKSCDKLDWRVEATSGHSVNTPRSEAPVLTIGSDTRFAILSAPSGTYKVGTTAPNGTSSSLLVTLQ